MLDTFTASKTRAKDGAVWVLAFRHPLKPDPRGKLGRKMRRSTGTADEARAQILVEQMNALLSDEGWFDTSRQSEASKTFDEVVVRAFYDDLTTPTDRSFDIRESRLPLPTKSQGYARVLLVGSTGAGKTSLLRQLIGSDPKTDRFPSTSASRTTISDIEVVTGSEDAGYSCVATFFSEWTVQTLVHECVADACASLWDTVSDEKIAERLLQHRDMRFRLSYILGGWARLETEGADALDGFDDDGPDFDSAGELTPTDVEVDAMQAVLRGYVERIRALSDEAKATILASSDFDGREAREDAQDRFEEAVQMLPDFDELVGDIMDEIRKRFDTITEGLSRRPGGWPEAWTFLSSKRDEFIPTIRRLSSNYAPSYGTLLTPLVDGIRVKGPFQAPVRSSSRKFVLFDGEGVGHTKDSAAGISAHVTGRFEDVDVILLVDSAKAPMLEGPTSLLRAVAASGHHQKLAIAFSHFDGLKRQANLPTAAARQAHVMASVTQALGSLRDVVGAPLVRALERDIDDRCFMLSYLDRSISDANPAPAKELRRLIEFLASKGAEQATPTKAEPAYNLARLHFSIQGAVNEFHGRWDAILGFGGTPGVRRAHWGEIKALNRRVVLRQENCEYKAANLMPAADLVARLAEKITRYLDTPHKWNGPAPSDEDAVAILSRIQREVYAKLKLLAARRLIDDRHERWVAAFHLRGRGSTFERARAIQGIFLEGSPLLGPDLSSTSAEFLEEVQTVVHDAVRNSGGTLTSGII
ncbi:hypothetical protein ACCS79_34185 [Rhizobium johnstonii]|uniref:hypothetical protein n=1 Tax=Rhizobium johnstonii TaxID=3019933 RepID=UPI003F9A2C39